MGTRQTYLSQRSVRRKRQQQRQRRIFSCLSAFILLLGVVWAIKAFQPAYPWLKVPSGFYRPDMLHSIHEVRPTEALQPLPLKTPDRVLKSQLRKLLTHYPRELQPHLFFFNLQDGRYVSFHGADSVPAASVIKLPILLAYFKQVDQGELTPKVRLAYQPFEQAAGSGTLQYKPPLGQLLSSLKVAQQMTQESDNSCTNILIYHLGGAQALNRLFEQSGLRRSHVANWLPDLQGTNRISMRDMAMILYNMVEGPYLSESSKRSAITLLEGTHNRGLIPAPLPHEVRVAHKTGDIGTSLGNAALVTLPNGHRYILAVQVQRPYNDYRAKDMIQQISKQVYEHIAEEPMLVNQSAGTL